MDARVPLVRSTAGQALADRLSRRGYGFRIRRAGRGVSSRLRELGYVEGRNMTIEFRWAEDDYGQLPRLAAELVHLKVDVIVTHGAPGTRAAMAATTMIPIVIATVGDAVST